MHANPPIVPIGLLLLTGLLPAQSVADCTVSYGSVTCTGDLQDGVSFAQDYTSVAVSGLTANITPGFGGTGVGLSYQGAAGGPGGAGHFAFNQTISYAGAPFTILGEGSGILVQAYGGVGGNGGEAQAGGAGGDGGNATIGFLSGSVATSGPESSGLYASSEGAAGGMGGAETTHFTNAHGGSGGAGGSGAAVTINVTQGDFTQQSGGFGIIAGLSQGGDGGAGAEGHAHADAAYGGAGGSGGSAGTVEINLGQVTASMTGGTGAAVMALGFGGQGADGGEGDSTTVDAHGGAGGNGGDGGALSITSGTSAYPGTLQIATSQANQHGVQANSVAGAGGNGNNGSGGGLGDGWGGDGGVGGTGGEVTINLSGATISTLGEQSQGIFARSYGGAGGNGGTGSGGGGRGGATLGGGPGGTVAVTFSGSLFTGMTPPDQTPVQTTNSPDANGIFAQSIGGFSGNGGSAVGFVAFGANDQSAGDGGAVSLNVQGDDSTIQTTGDWSTGLTAQSVGGGGGKGSKASGVVALGGTGSAGGNGGTVAVSNTAAVTTSGKGARTISAGSHGGGGGDGGGAGGVVAVGGASGAGGDAGNVTVNNSQSGTLQTSGDQADGLYAGSVGGGGGSAHSTAGLVAIGGSGGNGGTGGTVTVTNGASILTQGQDADGVFIHSVGGGGGDGSNALAVSAGFSLAIGGTGGGGGDGMAVTYTDGGTDSYEISTAGNRARGVVVQSLGGGGGDGGSAISASGSPVLDIAIGASGTGGPGGNGGAAGATVNAGMVTTTGASASAVFVQSIGGGGGAAGTTVAAANGSELSVTAIVGGKGGAGGSGGQASAAVSGEVATTGDLSSGVFVHSVGGGGGHAGTTVAGSALSALSIQAKVGGRGGNGGSGGTVGVSADGSIATGGHGSAGIAAASIGGGGGDGSTSVTASGITGGTVGVTLGGDGGGGGDGAGVTVTNSADIATTGAISEGIRAQSIAGGGGSSGTVVSTSGGALGDISVGVGGAGGGGGSSGLVTVTNQGGVTTSGTFATAIDAQSIAGGGGNAKGSITASGLSMGSLTATVGGRGGGGGTAGNVTVTSSGALATGGDLANGIVAQSLGGGGGEGGFAAEAGVTGGEVSGNVSLTFGGGGGAGGTAGEVLVNAPQGSIQTQGFGAVGILGQSIGGNGGNGANVYTANVAFSSDGSVQTNIGRGGTGGDSGVGGAVQIGNAAAITTQSFFATGILAQSIGGSGGSGGNVYTVVGAVSPGSAVTLGSALGGNGGTGNEAGTVSVTNSGTITTTAGGATAIHAASIGGGGGRAGNAANLNVDLTGAGAGSSLNATANVDVGGTGGAGGSGNAVTVRNSAAIQTSGIAAPGITALSIGGGGGDGGTASSFSYGLAGVCKLITGGSGYLCGSNATDAPTTKVNVSLTAEIGGKGAAAGNGGTVTVTNTANITTHGDLGHAISAQSIGGGGGTGGEGSTSIAGWTTSTAAAAVTSLGKTFTTLPKYTNISVAVGGSGGASGDGGNLDISHSALLNTSGDLAYGIHAQSVGGGGGKGGAGSDGLWGTIAVGGLGSGGGNGGAVTVTDTGAISTSGIGGIGIFAQSVGGGGGSAGNVEKGFAQSWEGLNIGVGVGYQQAAGAGGDGGAVTVTTGAITTTGDLAHGVIAQSVGGSGGIAAISGVFSGASNNFAGSAGDAGNGGAISVTLSGPVNVSGSQAHGLFAQSASGKGSGDTSGAVTIDVNANLTASGSLGRAILAQSASAGGANNGTVAINVAKGVTVGTGADGAETIGILGGANNTITNNGTLTQGNAASYVIRTDGKATTTITNKGIITGSVLGATSALAADPSQAGGALGASGIELQNRPGGLVNAGRLLDVSNLSNHGTLAVGGQGQSGNTRLTGNLIQVEGGVLAVDLNPGGSGSAGPSDRLSIDGRADLGGRLVVNLLDVWQPQSGPQSVLILTAGGGLTYGGLEHTQSAVAQYRFIEPSPGELHLGYDIDFANPGVLAVTNDNQDAIARHLHGVYRSQALDQGIARDLIAIEDQASYARVMNSLGAELAVNNQTVALLSTIAFNDALLSCAERIGDYRFFDQGQCGWLRLRGQRFTQGETHDNLGFDANSWQLAAGGQIDVGNDWHLGTALSYEGRSLNADDSNASSDGGQFQAGVSAKRRWGATELSGSLAMGYGDFDNDRVLWPGAAVSGSQKLWLFSGQVRIAHLLQWGRWAFKPRLDLGVDYLNMDAFNESGTTDLRLRIDGQSDTYVNLQPAIDIATEIVTADGLLIRPKLTLGITQFLGDTSPTVSGRFADAPAQVPSFTASTGLDETRFDVAAAVDIFTRADLMIRAEVFGSFSDNSESYGGGLKIGMEF